MWPTTLILIYCVFTSKRIFPIKKYFFTNLCSSIIQCTVKTYFSPLNYNSDFSSFRDSKTEVLWGTRGLTVTAAVNISVHKFSKRLRATSKLQQQKGAKRQEPSTTLRTQKYMTQLQTISQHGDLTSVICSPLLPFPLLQAKIRSPNNI